MALADASVTEELSDLMRDFEDHRCEVEAVFRQRYSEVEGVIGGDQAVAADRALLIGAYFSQEYSYEAAALFNPSIVPHPDQSGVVAGAVRFILSLRAVGEGHVSSISFSMRCSAARTMRPKPEFRSEDHQSGCCHRESAQKVARSVLFQIVEHTGLLGKLRTNARRQPAYFPILHRFVALPQDRPEQRLAAMRRRA